MVTAQAADKKSARTGLPERLSNGRLAVEPLLTELVADGLVDVQAARRLAHDSRALLRGDLHPLVVIANRRLPRRDGDQRTLDLDCLTHWLAAKAGLRYVQIDPLEIDVDAVTRVVSRPYAEQYHILPLELSEQRVVVATSEPFCHGWEDDVAHLLRKEVETVLVNPLDMHRYTLEFYGLTRSVRAAGQTRFQNAPEGISNFEQLVELGEAGKLNADDRHIVTIVDWLLQYAFDQRASDIHLEPRRDVSGIRFRIDGKLARVYELPTPVMRAVVSRIKILGRMDLAEKRRPQDGRIKTRTPSGQEVEMRLSTMPTAFGEKCVMRIFDPDVAAKHFAQLGFSPTEIAAWESMVDRPHGIVLVTGPTGSGKTTTLYATLQHLAGPELNICSVEDPIEMVNPEFNQMQVQANIGLDFAEGVRTLLRQDPDIIMVGEIRDRETAEMAIQASLTGHLVLSTLHTNDAPSAVTRLLDLGVPYYLIRATLAGVVAQRLVRTLCPHCKQFEPIDKAAWKRLVHPWKTNIPENVGKPKGCKACRNTGFLGRTGLYEMMPLSPALRLMVHPDQDVEAVRKAAFEGGMRPLKISAAQQVAAGLTTVSECIDVIPE